MSPQSEGRRTEEETTESHRRRKILKTAGTGGVALITGLAGCAQRTQTGGGSSAGSANETTSGDGTLPNKIKIGMTNALSGPNAATGQIYKNAYNMAVDDINNGADATPYSWDGGGVYLSEHDTRLPVELLIRDSQSKADRAVNQYQQLISQENIPAAIGPYSSTVTYAVGSILEENKVPWIADAAANPRIHKQGWDYFFSVETPVDKWNRPQIKWLANAKPEPQKVGVFHSNSSVNTAGAEGMVAYAKNNTDLDIEMIGSYPVEPSNLAPLIRKAASKGVDTFLNSGHLAGDTTFVRQMYTTGVANQAKAIGVGLSVALPEFYKALGSNSIGVHGPQLWHPAVTKALSYSGAQAFVQRYKKEYGSPPDYHAANGFDAVNIMGKAIEKAGTLDSQAIKKQLNTAAFSHTLRGKIEFKDNGIMKGAGSMTVQLQGSMPSPKLEVISPQSLKTAEPIYPL
jgi:branched-chain amino acid transport system substrate-binding protein